MQEETPILELDNVVKTFISGDKAIHVLEDISFIVSYGEILAIVGPSGSGKSTLLGLCAGLDDPTSGQIQLFGKNLDNLSQDKRAKLRNRHVGFIFQNFQLIPTLTALENVMLPLELASHPEAKEHAIELLYRVGLSARTNHYPSQLSGGEQQRVALARAFSNTPQVLFADEPTGNLDESTSDQIEQLMFDLNAEYNTTLIIITHDMALAHRAQRIIHLKGGRIKEEVSSQILR